VYWKINLFSTHKESHSKSLKCGDIVWIHHSEVNNSLIVTDKTKSYDMMVSDRLLLRENCELMIEQNGIIENFEEYLGNTSGMWMIEHKNFDEGGLVLYNAQYRLRNLSTGLYLSHDRKGHDFSQNSDNFKPRNSLRFSRTITNLQTLG